MTGKSADNSRLIVDIQKLIMHHWLLHVTTTNHNVNVHRFIKFSFMKLM